MSYPPYFQKAFSKYERIFKKMRNLLAILLNASRFAKFHWIITKNTLKTTS